MNEHDQSHGFYESFNARTLRPEQVAQRFVPSDHFRRLFRVCHSVVVGPRGSGKTTLLKMLEQPAVETWSHPDADEYRRQVNYSGVFVATDVNWKSQIDSLSSVNFSATESRLFGSAAFTTHVLRSLVTSFRYRSNTKPAPFPHRRVTLEGERESRLVRSVSEIWKIKPPLPTLLSLRHALSARLNQIRELASREQLRDSKDRAARLSDDPYLHIWYLPAVTTAVELFNDLVDEPDAKWALLFDELELAPEWIREELMQSTRSVDDRLLFKLSISPYEEHSSAHGLLAPTQDNDYDAIPLWYANREDGYDFCRQLWEALLAQRGIQDTDAESTLGPSIFDLTDDASNSKSRYAPNSAHHRRFLELAKNDATFRQHLEEKNIAVSDLHEGSEKWRASEIRKIISIVAARHTYRTPDRSGGRQRIRSRKNPKLFVGATSLFAMIEANPRWLNAIGSRLLDKIGPNNKIAEADQSQEISNAAERFQAMLETIPCPVQTENSFCVADVIDVIGRYFFKVVVLDDFNAEPPGSFTVDDRVDSALHDILGQALNVGALVRITDDSENVVLGSLVNVRFRLCYLLAASYHFPVRLGRSVSLSHILTEMGPESKKNDTSQVSLF